VASVANNTTKHNRAALSHAKLTEGLGTLRPALWRLAYSGGSFYYQKLGDTNVSRAVKKAISLPADLAAEVEAIARDENKSLSAVVQDALRALKRSRLRGEFRELQGYWSKRAQAAGILSERDLERLLRR
jgi:hypothetical protein